MHVPRSIRLKAFLLLAIFTANFTVFCHCATAQKRRCCCEKQAAKKPCHNAQAVKFNLAERLLADHIQATPLPTTWVVPAYAHTQTAQRPMPVIDDAFGHPPPDLLVFQHKLLI